MLPLLLVIFVIQLNELIEWASKNNNKLLLPKRIQTYINSANL